MGNAESNRMHRMVRGALLAGFIEGAPAAWREVNDRIIDAGRMTPDLYRIIREAQRMLIEDGLCAECGRKRRGERSAPWWSTCGRDACESQYVVRRTMWRLAGGEEVSSR